MRFRLLLLLGIFASTAVASDRLEFCAYLRVGSQELFILGNPATGKSSDWLKVGDSFGGHSIGKFDRESETLTVTAAGQTFPLPLKSSKLQQSGAQDGPTGALSTRLEMARSVLKTMRMRYRNAHPAIKAQLHEIADLERQLAERNAKR